MHAGLPLLLAVAFRQWHIYAACKGLLHAIWHCINCTKIIVYEILKEKKH